ncbi:MAG: hypothetical protein LDL41_23125, partial [Coleofasciculus sp. S288]|nr:hypothetical protein [Coleofasciculus sp. S288]
REIPEDDLQTGEELGRIDLRFTHGYREDVYFAFECKRLNVVLNGRRRALAAEYVVQGMMRFITSQYATNLTQGGIIGYIMNGDTTTAVRAVSSRVGRQCQELRISSPSSLCKSSLLPSNKQIKETRHDLENRKFIIHHIFLPI